MNILENSWWNIYRKFKGMRIFQKEKGQENLGYRKTKLAELWWNLQKKIKWLVSLKGRISALKKVIEKWETIRKILSVIVWYNLKKLKK